VNRYHKRSKTSESSLKSVSFSGVDGAGKTTQINHLLASVQQRGMKVRVLRFWDDIATFTRVREGTGHKLFKGDKGIGSPDAPINRRDKNVRSWPMTCIRMFLYLADAISLRRAFAASARGDAGFVIFDRYAYDELANLNLNSSAMKMYVRFIMWLVPRPDISFLLDADAEAARARKPEYPIEFIRVNRQAYFQLNELVGGFTVIPPADLELATAEVSMAVQQFLSADSKSKGGRDSFTRMEPPETGPALS
jgi:thymidylate kinase